MDEFIPESSSRRSASRLAAVRSGRLRSAGSTRWRAACSLAEMSLRRSVIAVSLMIVGLALWAAMASGAIGNESHGAAHAPSLQDPTYAACVNSGAVICNPAAHQTDVAENPVGRPPNPNARMMSRNEAITAARQLAASQNTSVAAASAPVFARMTTEKEFEALQPGGVDHFANQQRLFWVVTVHAPVSATDRIVRHYDVYTVQIDAETSQIYRVCLGCDSVRS